MNKQLLKRYVQLQSFLKTANQKLKEKDGNFFTENGLSIVIAVVIGGILLLAVVALFKDKIFPKLNSKVDDFFAIS